jgi:2-polyprenyl-6-methoxyphenol hydroxylase-like FAD-dependent oxidoreductase
MTPFRGEGVNKAMKDALELAEWIGKAMDPREGVELNEAVKRYEEGMFPRAEEIQAATLRNKEWLFGPDAPIGIISGVLKQMTRDSGSVYVRMLGTKPVMGEVFAYFWVRQQIGWVVRRFWRKN